MKDICYLIFTTNGVIRMSKGRPTLKGFEYAVKINVEVPVGFFKDPPMSECTVILPEEYQSERRVTVDILNYHDTTGP